MQAPGHIFVILRYLEITIIEPVGANWRGDVSTVMKTKWTPQKVSRHFFLQKGPLARLFLLKEVKVSPDHEI